MKITALAGGVGGAKLVNGLSKILSPEDLDIIVNTGDDFQYLGFYICPDLDTVMYNLAGINNPVTGYGIANDTFTVITGLEKLGQEIWFRIGDTDIATQIERTQSLQSGLTLSEVVSKISCRLGIKQNIYPMSDKPVKTLILTNQNSILSFQEYFVKCSFQPVVKEIIFEGSEKSQIPKQVRSSLEGSDAIIICPSNPYVSIDPILSIPGVAELLKEKIVVAVSPLIGGKTIKGPAAKIMTELGVKVCSASVAQHYSDFLAGIVIDIQDNHEKDQISRWGIIPYMTNIYMPDVKAQIDLAKHVLDFSLSLIKGKAR